MASSTALSSGLLTASAAVKASKTILSSIIVNSDGTNNATVIVYDNASAASGTVLAKILVIGAQGHKNITFNSRVRADNGLYVSITGTGAEAIVYYDA